MWKDKIVFNFHLKKSNEVDEYLGKLEGMMLMGYSWLFAQKWLLGTVWDGVGVGGVELLSIPG